MRARARWSIAVGAAVCLGIVLTFYGFVAVRGDFSKAPAGIEELVTPASIVLAVLAYVDLRARRVATRGAIALLAFILPPIGVWLWVSTARRRRPPPPSPQASPVSRTGAGRTRPPRRRG